MSMQNRQTYDQVFPSRPYELCCKWWLPVTRKRWWWTDGEIHLPLEATVKLHEDGLSKITVNASAEQQIPLQEVLEGDRLIKSRSEIEGDEEGCRMPCYQCGVARYEAET